MPRKFVCKNHHSRSTRSDMKHHFLLLLAFGLLPLSGFAQIHDRSYGFGFTTYPSVIKPIGNDRWVVLGGTTPDLNWFFQDSLFLMVLRHDGSIEMKVTLDVLPSEVSRAVDLLPLPDGGFAVLTISGGCDVFGTPNMLQKIRPDGSQAWKFAPNGTFSELMESLHLASDGNIMGRTYNQMLKISTATGEILENTPIAIDNQSLYEIAFIPGKEDFMAVGTPDFQYWKKTPTPAGFQYQMSKSADYPDVFHTGLEVSPEGWFYTATGSINNADKWLARINAGLDYETLTPTGYVQQIQPGTNGVYLLEYNYSTEKSSLRKTDWLGQTLSQLTIAEARLRVQSIAVRGDSIALAGEEYYGVSNLFGYWDASYCWVRTFKGMAPVTSGPVYNAAITAVEQQSPVDTASHVLSIFGEIRRLYTLKGGNFRLQITNKGDTVLQRVFANIRFGRDYSTGICYIFPTYQHLYEGLNLHPSESTWVDFGDIWASNQSPLPTQLCFWTAAPDERPDQNHADDHFCHAAKFTSIVTDPESPGIKISPNPANDLLDISAPNGFGSEGRWRLFDFTGKNTMEGAWPSGQTAASLSVAHLPNGLYTLLVGQISFKIVVQH